VKVYTLKGFANALLRRLSNAFSVVMNKSTCPRVIPWAKLDNAFGVNNSSFDTPSKLLG
jgi:hypothetical protein